MRDLQPRFHASPHGIWIRNGALRLFRFLLGSSLVVARLRADAVHGAGGAALSTSPIGFAAACKVGDAGK